MILTFEIVGIILSLILFICAAFDVFWPSTLALVLAFGVGVTLHGFIPLFWKLWHPEVIGAYIVIGLLWVFFKWARLIERSLKNGALRPPKWSDNWDDFFAYFFYWPLDMVGYILSDFLREVWKFVSKMVSRSFDKYAEWRYAQYHKSKGVL